MSLIVDHPAPETATAQEPEIKRLVLVGAGHAHVQVLRTLNINNREQNVCITLIDVQSVASYSGMIPGYLAKLYTANHTATIDLQQLADWAKVTLINDGVLDVDVDKQLVYLVEESAPIPYDVISFDIGSATRGLDEISGAFDFAIPTRPISELIELNKPT